MKSKPNFWAYLPQFFFEWEHFYTNVAEEIKTQKSPSLTFSRKSRLLWDNVEEYGTAGQATDDNLAHAHCMLDTHTHTHTQKM